MFSIPEKVEDDEVWNGSRRLLVAILNQAIEDVRFKAGRRPRKEESEHSKRRWSNRVIARSMANWWIFGKYKGDDDFFTFDEVCHYLNMEPSMVRRKLLDSGIKDKSDKVVNVDKVNVDFTI